MIEAYVQAAVWLIVSGLAWDVSRRALNAVWSGKAADAKLVDLDKAIANVAEGTQLGYSELAARVEKLESRLPIDGDVQEGRTWRD